MAEDGQEEPKTRRVRKQTKFFEHEKKTRGLRRLSMDVGERPADLKPSLKKTDYSASSTSKMAKKIKRKYSRERKINFHNTCRVALITPLPGWNPYAIRMDEDDENLTAVSRLPKPREHRLIKNLKITPLSLQKIVSTNIMDDEDETRIEFNAKFLFNGSEEDSSGKSVDVKSRRKSAVRLSPEALAAIFPETESADVAGGDAKADEISVRTKDRRKTRRSLVFPSQLVAKEPKEEPLPPPLSAAQQPKNKSRNRCRSTAITVPPMDITPEVAIITEKSETSLLGEKVSNGDGRTTTLRKKVKVSRVSDWVMKAPVEIRDTSLEREHKQHTGAFDNCVAVSTLSESSLMKEVKERRKAIRHVVVEKSKSPEIEEVFCSKALKRKNVTAAETQKAKRGLFEQEHDREDFAPIPLFHCLEAIHVSDQYDDYPDVPIVSREVRELTWTDSFPANECPPTVSSIQLVKADEKDEKLRNSFAREWIEIFTNFDPTAAWTTAFGPTVSRQWLGDSLIIEKARNFIKSWKARVSKERSLFVSPIDKTKFRKRSAEESDCSDYEDDSVIQTNPLIICGPPGSGKTALITCLAAEFDMDVLEIHPGDRRNAAALKQKFDGAIRNQAVQPKSGSIATFFGSSGSQKKETRPRQNIVVIEHVDISFEDDRDFWPTIKALASESRIPIIWTCEKMPTCEIYRAPGLDFFEQIYIDYSPASLVSKYVQCCLLLTRQLTAPLSELEQYVKAFSCDLRRILADLQVQTATLDLKLILPIRSRGLSSPLICDQASTYRSRQEHMSAKKGSYQHILDELELVDISYSAPEKLVQTATALDRRLPSSNLAIDFLPYLVEMDNVERKKTGPSRRYLHYFKEVRSEVQVDRYGQLLPIVRNFSFYK